MSAWNVGSATRERRAGRRLRATSVLLGCGCEAVVLHGREIADDHEAQWHADELDCGLHQGRPWASAATRPLHLTTLK